MARDDVEGVTTPTELLRSHQNGQTKTHVVLDGTDRPTLVFTAVVDAKEGDPCMCTEYVYKNATSVIAINQQERVYKWKAIWDSLYLFDPTVDYDIDGDGIL